jgi:Type I phosphodiesterase / nucleotide pyrophosphatase
MKISQLLIGLCALSTVSAVAQERGNEWDRSDVRHVLLISVDGMHAVDFLNCSKGIPTVNNGAPYCPHLAALGKRGINYVAASTSRPSDSFPGLTAIITGATPRTAGTYYDIAYDRSLDAPAKDTGNGTAAGPCTPGAAPTGTTTEYEEAIDIDQSKLNGGEPGAPLTGGSVKAIDPMRLPRDPKRGCAPVWPWEFVRVNSIFTVIHDAGGYVAWSDKHVAYSSVSSGKDGYILDDFYSPEINSAVVALPGVKTPTGIDCSVVHDVADTSDWTRGFENIQCYDQLKVTGVLNQIDGKTHDGKNAKVPEIFGMNFQAVSVGQKLIEKKGPTGGYVDGMGTPTPSLLTEFQFVDDSIGEMVDHLKDNGLLDKTLIVITAKHGQSPIDPNRFFGIPGTSGTGGTSPGNLLDSYLPLSESNNGPGPGTTEDDISLLWLKHSSDTNAAVGILEANAAKAGIGEIFYGNALSQNYGSPLTDPRTPDIIVQPNVGVVYTGSARKLAEHGGFAHDDTNVILLLSNPEFDGKTVHADVSTTQVAPTILKVLGIDPKKLDGVRLEGTPVLPAAEYEELQ